MINPLFVTSSRGGPMVLAVLFALFGNHLAFAQSTQAWSLRQSIQRVLEVAPETRISAAQLKSRQADLSQALAWPNPEISLRADEKLGIDDGKGGIDLTNFSITQPLPLGRLARRGKVAEANLMAAQANSQQQQLYLEHATALVFHHLQLTQANFHLAQQQLKLAQDYRQKKRNGHRDPLVRYLTPLEKQRLNIMYETANQALSTAEGKYEEARARFTSLLQLDTQNKLTVTDLKPVSRTADLHSLEQQLQTHASLLTRQRKLDAARAGIDASRDVNRADPTLTVFRERDYLAGRRTDYNGIVLGIQIPLWQSQKNYMAKAKAKRDEALAQLQSTQRDLSAHLHQSYTHLGHVIGQARNHRQNLLRPAKQVLELSRRGFASGELNLLALIDANNTYFGARRHYFELMQRALMEAAELRLAAGLSYLDNNQDVITWGVKHD